MQGEHIQLVVTVLLANHSDQQHIYDFPPSTTEAKMREIVEEVQNKIAETLVNQTPLSLLNPVISYQAAQIVGIKLTPIGEGDLALQQAIEDQQRGMQDSYGTRWPYLGMN